MVQIVPEKGLDSGFLIEEVGELEGTRKGRVHLAQHVDGIFGDSVVMIEGDQH